jgi:predicted SAM-dependent methyltransferase
MKSKIMVKLLRKIFPPNENHKKVNIGSGNWYYPRWETIDLKATKIEPDYRIDLSNGKLPFEDEFVHIFFTENFLYYLDDVGVKTILSECYRCLSNNGVIHIGLPFSDDEDGKRVYEQLLEHKTVFTVSLLKEYLKNAKFRYINEVQCRKSSFIPRNFMFDRKLKYLRFFEAQKRVIS